MSDTERVAADEPLCDCCQKPCYPIKADWGGYFCGKCYQYVKRMYCKLADVRTEFASVTARLAAAEETAVKVADAIDNCERQGEAIDSPEGARFITISHTMAVHLVAALRGFYYYKLDDAAIAAAVSAGWMQPLGEGGGE